MVSTATDAAGASSTHQEAHISKSQPEERLGAGAGGDNGSIGDNGGGDGDSLLRERKWQPHVILVKKW